MYLILIVLKFILIHKSAILFQIVYVSTKKPKLQLPRGK